MLFFFSLSLSTHTISSQKLDLIITSSGDSIACKIDSITNSHIYIKWKNGRSWERTYLGKSKPIECQYDVIDKKLVVYEPGTPNIKYLKKQIELKEPDSSNNLDLVITSSGDSIACLIDSITSSHIYIKWKNSYKWEQTYLLKTEDVEYQYNVINQERVVYKSGTPYIKYVKKPIIVELLKKNAIYITAAFNPLILMSLNINYERIVKQKQYAFFNVIAIKSGIGKWTALEGGGANFHSGLTTLSGIKSNHFETNIGGSLFYYKGQRYTSITEYTEFHEFIVFPMINLGYRYQKPKGDFIFRTGAGFPEGFYISLGICF